MIQSFNIKQFNCPIVAIQLSNCGNSIVQLMKNIFIHGKGTKHGM